jgi:hypothetical protein
MRTVSLLSKVSGGLSTPIIGCEAGGQFNRSTKIASELDRFERNFVAAPDHRDWHAPVGGQKRRRWQAHHVRIGGKLELYLAIGALCEYPLRIVGP